MTTMSRVTDTHKPITSRTGLKRAEKARDTLQTAVEILRASTDDPIQNEMAAMQVSRNIAALNREISTYYRNLR